MSHCCNLFLTKNCKQFNGGKTAFSTNSTGTTGHPYAKKMNLYLNFRLIQTLTKLLENKPTHLHDLGLSTGFSDWIPKARPIKGKIIKVGLIKIKNFWWISLVVQWLRSCLPVKGTWV